MCVCVYVNGVLLCWGGNICTLPTCLWLAATNHVYICVWSGTENWKQQSQHTTAATGSTAGCWMYSSTLNFHTLILNNCLLMDSKQDHMVSVMQLIGFVIQHTVCLGGDTCKHTLACKTYQTINTCLADVITERCPFHYCLFASPVQWRTVQKSKFKVKMHAAASTSPQDITKIIYQSCTWTRHNKRLLATASLKMFNASLSHEFALWLKHILIKKRRNNFSVRFKQINCYQNTAFQ